MHRGLDRHPVARHGGHGRQRLRVLHHQVHGGELCHPDRAHLREEGLREGKTPAREGKASLGSFVSCFSNIVKNFERLLHRIFFLSDQKVCQCVRCKVSTSLSQSRWH